MKTGNFSLVVLKQFVPPNMLCSILAVICQSLADGFIRTKSGAFQSLWFTMCAQYKNPICKVLGDYLLYRAQTQCGVAVKVDQQNHEAFGKFAHQIDMNFREPVAYSTPSARFWNDLNLPIE